MTTTYQVAESPTRACNDTCGCLTDTAPAATSFQAVPLLATAAAAGADAAA
jgi:hypothetical protein